MGNGIYVSEKIINEYIYDVQGTISLIEGKTSDTDNYGNMVLTRLENAYKNAREALKVMEADDEQARKTLRHDEEVLKKLKRQLEEAKARLEILRVQVEKTYSLYKSAMSEQTAARNSSIPDGGSEEERAAARRMRNERIRMADINLKHARELYEKTKQEYKNTQELIAYLQKAIQETERAIKILKEFICDLGEQISKAEYFCKYCQENISKLQKQLCDFDTDSRNIISELERCTSYAHEAEKCVAAAVRALNEAGATHSFSSRDQLIIMDSPLSLNEMIRVVDSLYSENTRSLDGLKRDARHYGNVMQDEISENATYVSLDICEKINRQTKVFVEIKGSLKKAQKHLNEYMNYSSAL